MKSEVNNLFEYFAGEYLSILVNKDLRQSIQTPDNVRTIHSPVLVEGYLIDEDDLFYYMGEDPGTIYKAVAKRTIVMVEIIDPHADMADALNDSVATPTDDKGIN